MAASFRALSSDGSSAILDAVQLEDVPGRGNVAEIWIGSLHIAAAQHAASQKCNSLRCTNDVASTRSKLCTACFKKYASLACAPERKPRFLLPFLPQRADARPDDSGAPQPAGASAAAVPGSYADGGAHLAPSMDGCGSSSSENEGCRSKRPATADLGAVSKPEKHVSGWGGLVENIQDHVQTQKRPQA